MGNLWTTSKVLELAPDDSSIKAAKGLANPNKWSDLGFTERAVWGQCKGSGKKPYQTRIDLNGLAFKCSCPSRKFPCKHSLALFLLFVDKTKLFTETSLPGWVNEWIEGRDSREEKKEQKQKAAQKPSDPEAQAKRIAQREKKILAGLEELSLWLSDMLRQGLAWAHTQPMSYWNNMAARMVDSQASGLSNQIKKMGEIAMSGQNWQDRLLSQIGRTYLLIEAYKRQEYLDDDLRQDVRSLVGWTVPKEQLLNENAIQDQWLVLSQRVEQQDHLEVQRTWLWGKNKKRYALILDFAVGNAVLDKTLVVGTMIEAGLVFYPGVDPQRALIKDRKNEIKLIEGIDIDHSISMLFSSYANRLEKMPWTETVPCFLGPVQILPEYSYDDTLTGWYGVDTDNNKIMMSSQFRQGWHLLCVSGGKPVTVFGQWDGHSLLPMSILFNNQFYSVIESPVSGLRRVG